MLFKRRAWTGDSRTFTLKEVLTRSFTEDADSGVAENAAAHARHLAEKLSTLVLLLYDNGTLTKSDLVDLLDGSFEEAE